MAWTGGSVSFSWNGSNYDVSYSDPSYSDPPSGYSISSGPYISTAGPSSVSANASASQIYEVELFRSTPFSIIYSNKTVSGTAPGVPGPSYTTVPTNLVGATEDVATIRVIQASLNPEVSYTTDGATTGNHGTVKSVSPATGQSIVVGGTVTLTVYKYEDWLGLGVTAIANSGLLGPTQLYASWTAWNKTFSSQDVTISVSPSLPTFPRSYTLSSGTQNSWTSQSPNYLTGNYETTYTFTITGTTDYGTESASAAATTADTPTYPPSWSDSTLADTFRIGEAYSDGVSASGTSPITYSVTAGSLPSGITLNSNGTVTGTPTTKGAYSFTIRASNGIGSPVTASFSGTVLNAKGEVYVYDAGTGTWNNAAVKKLDGSGGSSAAEVYFTPDGTTWVKSL